MTNRKRSSIGIVSGTLETKAFSISIRNEGGVHTHTRNGEQFKGKQRDCPLCASGSQFEKSVGPIGAE